MGGGENRWQNHCLTERPASHIKEFPRDGPYLLADGGPPMNPTRRDFLKLTTIGGAAAAVFGFDLKPAYAQLRTLKIARASETRSTCPYCAVGCGTIIYTIGDRARNLTAQVVPVEGGPDPPTTRASLFPTGASFRQAIMIYPRVLHPLRTQ